MSVRFLLPPIYYLNETNLSRDFIFLSEVVSFLFYVAQYSLDDTIVQGNLLIS